MSDSADDEPTSYTVQVKLTTYSKVTKAPRKKGQTTTTSWKKNPRIKSKELDYNFQDSDENYIAFLNALLMACSLKFSVTPTRRFTISVQVPPALKAGAIDVDKLSDYSRVVAKIASGTVDKAITVYMDEQEIKRKKLPKRQEDAQDDSQDDLTDEDKSASDDANGGELSNLERELARIRGLLEEKYRSDHDNTFAYPDPVSGELWPLTLFMMKEWARNIYDGKATISVIRDLLSPSICLLLENARSHGTADA
ncbi:hypothetical protein K435DRAFT_873584 [Dendrothele bispora CBS 962.96]|uniref:Uncharacterized protein n=1 Tax=Dendrothele bispora (strain CBS 962.96) TaxID=1314807 RepID=A0A4S8KYS6_DENBC|nr:hypothetical protein K435DRAFT_873584 [Dendrothele bispora CBS 962.96]